MRPTDNQIRKEKPFKHVPTHAASTFLRSATLPATGRATGPVLDDVALKDLDPSVIACRFLLLAEIPGAQRRQTELPRSRFSMMEPLPTNLPLMNLPWIKLSKTDMPRTNLPARVISLDQKVPLNVP
jgi:hypothetical protein